MNSSTLKTPTKTIATSPLAQLTASGLEGAFDSFLKDGPLKGLPLVRGIIAIYQTHRSVREVLERRKLVRFLEEIEKTTPEERAAFSKTYDGAKKQDDLGERTLLLLDRADQMRKVTLIGRIMAACIRGRMPLDTASRLCSMVSRCYFEDLEYLRTFKDGTQGRGALIAESLFAAGFLSDGGVDGGNYSEPDSGGTIYVMNEYGQMLVPFLQDGGAAN